MSQFWLPKQIDLMVSAQLRAEPSPGPRPYLTISRAYGCDGHPLAAAIVERLGQIDRGGVWRVADRKSLLEASDSRHLSKETLEALQRYGHSHFESFLAENVLGKGSPAMAMRQLGRVMRFLARQGRVVILGAGACVFTQDIPGGIHVRLDASEAWRIANHARRWGIDEDRARKNVRDRSQQREAWVTTITGRRLDDPELFDLRFDNEVLTAGEAADAVIRELRRRARLG